MASSISAWSASATRACTAPVAGLKTGAVRPLRGRALGAVDPVRDDPVGSGLRGRCGDGVCGAHELFLRASVQAVTLERGVDQGGGRVHGAGDVAVRGVEQGAPDGEAAHAGKASASCPRGERLVGVDAGVSAEQQRRHGGRLHHALHVVDDGQLHPACTRCSRRGPRRWRSRVITASVDRSLTIRPSCQRLMNGSSMIGSRRGGGLRDGIAPSPAASARCPRRRG